MKKYRPYKEFPDDIIGKTVITEHGSKMMITAIASGKIMLATFSTYEKDDAFKRLIFLDGTPVGEEYEEKVELEHDKVYLVRDSKHDNWIPRFFRMCNGEIYRFYCGGRSSQTVDNDYDTNVWSYVCEYDEDLKGTTKEPSSYLVKPE